MRVLVASTGHAGDWSPLVPFADALSRHGHDVLWPAGEAGLQRMLEALAQWRPHIVLREPAEYASAVAAELFSVAHARVATGLSLTENLALAAAAEGVDQLRSSVGLRSDPGADALRDSPYLSLFPASLEDPDAPEQLHTLRFRDPAWDEVHPQAAAVVHEGDPGQMLHALAAGVPVVVVPASAHADHSARRIAQTGSGIVANGEDPGAIRDALALVHDDPSYRTAAGRIAAEMESQWPTDAVVAVLAALVATEAVRPPR